MLIIDEVLEEYMNGVMSVLLNLCWILVILTQHAVYQVESIATWQ